MSAYIARLLTEDLSVNKWDIMKRFIATLTLAAFFFLGFAPAVSADADFSDRCDRHEQIEERLENKAERVDAKAERIEQRIANVTERLADLDPADEDAVAKAERRLNRLENKAEKTQAKAERIAARLEALAAACA